MSLGDMFDGCMEDTQGRYGLRSPKVGGILLGVITENGNDEHKGMVKVEILSKDASKNITEWARVATSYAGSAHGFYALPEVGDEVLVAFLDGNIERPYVISCIYKGDSEYGNGNFHEDNVIKKLKTKGGCEVIFHDEADKQYISMATPAGHKVTLNDEKKNIQISDKDGKNFLEIASEKGELSITSEKKVTITSGSLTITMDGNGKKTSIEADTLELNGKQQLNIKSQTMKIEGQSMKVEGQSLKLEGQSLDIKGAAQCNIAADGILKIAGSMVKLN